MVPLEEGPEDSELLLEPGGAVLVLPFEKVEEAVDGWGGDVLEEHVCRPKLFDALGDQAVGGKGALGESVDGSFFVGDPSVGTFPDTGRDLVDGVHAGEEFLFDFLGLDFGSSAEGFVPGSSVFTPVEIPVIRGAFLS